MLVRRSDRLMFADQTRGSDQRRNLRVSMMP